MFAFNALCLALIGVCVAVPLESPSSDQASQMLVELEPSPVIQPPDQLEPITNLEPMNMEQEPSPVIQPADQLEQILNLEPMNMEQEPSPVIQPADQLEQILNLEPMNMEQELSPVIQPADQLESILNLEPMNMEPQTSSAEEYFDPRIIGGTDAPETKHMVALILGWHVKSFTCGGSLISPRHTLTAAHCIMKDWIHGGLLESYHGVVGSNTWNHGGSVIEFVGSLEHPEYNAATIKNDVAVLKMKTDVPLSKRIQPIRLELGSVDSGVPCYATGWGEEQLWGGAAQRLQILFLQTISEEKCRKLIGQIVGQGNSPPIDYSAEICGFHSWGHGMCFGDSGSALVSLLNKRQIGIVSWGIACAVGAPDVYVSVPAMGWFIKFAVKHM